MGVLLVSLLWLDGPGWRWLGAMGLRELSTQVGIEAEFTLTGRLHDSAAIEGISLQGGPIRSLRIDAIKPRYRIHQAFRGKIDGLSVTGLRATIDLDAPPLPLPRTRRAPSAGSYPLAQTLRKLAVALQPLDLQGQILRLEVVRGEQSLLRTDRFDLQHSSNSEDYSFQIAGPRIGQELHLPDQRGILTSDGSSLEIDRLDLQPHFSLRDLRLQLPLDAAPQGSAVLHWADSRLKISVTQSTARLRLEGKPLQLDRAARDLSFPLPAEISVQRFTAEVSGIDRSPDQWIASAQMELRSLRHRGWLADDLDVRLSKNGSRGQIDVTTKAYGTQIQTKAELIWRDLAARQWLDFEARLQTSTGDLSPLFATLRQELALAPSADMAVPEASLGIDARLDLSTSGLRSARAKWRLSTRDDLAFLSGEGTWSPAGEISGEMKTEGLGTRYQLDLKSGHYDASTDFDHFQLDRFVPWLAIGGIKVPEGIGASGKWRGKGNWQVASHTGDLELECVTRETASSPPLSVHARSSYEWPNRISCSEFSARMDDQRLDAAFHFARPTLEIPRLSLHKGSQLLVAGRASLPCAPATASLADFLQQEGQVDIDLASEWLDVALLKAFIPSAKLPATEGSARFELRLKGSPSAPRIDFDTSLRDLRLASYPELPPTHGKLELRANSGVLTLGGEWQGGDAAPIRIDGRMPFEPLVWARQPDRFLTQSFTARAHIPRFDLSTLRSLLPDARLEGTINGELRAAGSIAQPVLGGEVEVSGVSFTGSRSSLPPIRNASGLIQLHNRELQLKSLSLDCLGGKLDARGRIDLVDFAHPAFDLSANAVAIPIRRDDSMIVRANARLALRGNLQRAEISGGIDLVDSVFYRDFELIPIRVPFTAPTRPRLPAIDPEESAPAISAPFDAWTLDLRLRTLDPLLIRGNLARGRAIADLRLGGTLGKIEALGTATLDEVTARLPFSTLKVRNGSIRFDPSRGWIPELDLRGSSSIGRYDVNVFFYGPANSPTTTLTSDPPLPESEIMTLLATGTTTEGLEDGQAATYKAAQLFIEEWRRGRMPFAEPLAKVLALLNNVDVRIGEDDPLTGKRLSSATLELTDHVAISGSVDKEGQTRVLGAFILRFK